MTGTFSFPTRVEFGPGVLQRLPEFTRGMGRQVLVVTDKGVAGSGVLEQVLTTLKSCDLDVRVFDHVEPNPTEANITEGVHRFREGCDFLIGLGGGSPIDAAKAIGLMATHEGPLAQYDDQLNGGDLITGDVPPLIAIPTTAGTGSEVGRSTVITINERKTVIFSPRLMPTIALCDPELTLDLPARVTAGTGADALTHNLEAYLSKGFQPLCDAIALDGMRRARRWLPVVMQDGHNVEARSEMMIAAMMGATAFQKGLGVVHSLAHPLSTVAGIHHGTANAIMLPHALRFNRAAILDRIGAVAEALGVAAGSTPDETVDRVAEDLSTLFAEIGLPLRLHQLNVTEALIGPMAALAMQDACHQLNPRPVTEADMRELYLAAL
jgi:alcohol dehydrogenase class IV